MRIAAENLAVFELHVCDLSTIVDNDVDILFQDEEECVRETHLSSFTDAITRGRPRNHASLVPVHKTKMRDIAAYRWVKPFLDAAISSGGVSRP